MFNLHVSFSLFLFVRAPVFLYFCSMRTIQLKKRWCGWLVCCLVVVQVAAQSSFRVRGRVIDRVSRQPVMGAFVSPVSADSLRAVTDTAGVFVLSQVPPGICSFRVRAAGYVPQETPDYIVSAVTPEVNVELEEDVKSLQTLTVRPRLYGKTAEAPVSVQVIGLREIEKSPGANRDISRIVRGYPGVAFSPVGYRNDLIVRGGGPSENRFYMDGIEIPNINHFATQGATGGPVSIVNADLVREIKFYTGAFPADRAGAMSSVLDFRLRDGSSESQSFKATLGASEAALSGSGHIGEKTTYLFSLRQSYLQLLFKMIGLPFLPNYIDGQFKVKTRLTPYDELTVMALAGVDRMELNTDLAGEDESSDYILSYLPKIEQETFTVGASYRHYAGRHVQTYVLSHNYLNDKNLKYRGNDDSSEDNLMLRLRSTEQKTTFRAENMTSLSGGWTLKENLELNYMDYADRERRLLSVGDWSVYRTHLGIVAYGASFSAAYTAPEERWSASVGLRADGNSYSSRMSRPWEQLSPRASFRYAFSPHWSAAASAGWYHQLPPYTALGYKDVSGRLANKALRYMNVAQTALGGEWRANDRWAVSAEGFYKSYYRVPLSLADGVPLTCKGTDYGVVGNEALVSTAQGRAYGVEALVRWTLPDRLNLTGSFTWYRSEYRADRHSAYVPSAWDNRWILNMSGTYDFPHRWSLGLRLSCIGGAPYTPYDEAASSYVSYWDAHGKSAYDYSRYNAERLPGYAQLDVRVDKEFFFRHWRLGLYLDLQNVTVSKLRQPDVFMSTGIVANPEVPLAEQRYVMRRIEQVSGTLLPTLGVTVEF